jgi:hypothetical protein
MSRTPSSIHGGCDLARSTTGHTHNIARAFYEDFSDLALFAAAGCSKPATVLGQPLLALGEVRHDAL